jgi:hypothetical protein
MFERQQIRTADSSIFTGRLISLLLLFLCFGCSIPTSRTRIIPEGIAGDPEHLVEKLTLLQPGMHFHETLQLLEIKPKTPGVREIVTADEKQKLLYGAAQVVGSPDELENFRERLGKHRILEIKLTDLERELRFDSLVSVLSTQRGPNFTAYLVFYEDSLVAPPNKPENFYVKETTRTYISDLIGAIFRGGLGRGIDQIGP